MTTLLTIVAAFLALQFTLIRWADASRPGFAASLRRAARLARRGLAVVGALALYFIHPVLLVGALATYGLWTAVSRWVRLARPKIAPALWLTPFALWTGLALFSLNVYEDGHRTWQQCMPDRWHCYDTAGPWLEFYPLYGGLALIFGALALGTLLGRRPAAS